MSEHYKTVNHMGIVEYESILPHDPTEYRSIEKVFIYTEEEERRAQEIVFSALDLINAQNATLEEQAEINSRLVGVLTQIGEGLLTFKPSPIVLNVIRLVMEGRVEETEKLLEMASGVPQRIYERCIDEYRQVLAWIEQVEGKI